MSLFLMELKIWAYCSNGESFRHRMKMTFKGKCMVLWAPITGVNPTACLPALAKTAFAAMNKVVSNLKKVADIASKGKGH